jgi:hypothetical protein
MRERRALLVLACVLFASGRDADALNLPEPEWVEAAAGCKFFERYPMPDTRYSWSGSCVDGYLSGDGTLELNGAMKWRFKGTFKEGRMLSGTIIFPAGQYTGELKDNLPDGRGAYRYTNGIVVEAVFAQGEAAGDATVTYPSGQKYVGPVTPQSNPQGKGRMTYPNGAVYEGDFVDGDLVGEGDMRYADGTHYVGEFRAGKRQGHGTQHFANGDEYVGDFVFDERHGSGRYVQANGDILEGEWQGGSLNGKCHIVVSSEDSEYSGSCISGKPHGRGLLTAPSYSYDGEFVHGMREGKGTLRVTDTGDTVTYEGDFKGGVMHGAGVLTTKQSTMQGEFRAGVLYRGTLTSKAGRKFEIDLEQDTVFEILPDGTKRPVSQADLRDLIV